ncbi:malonate decarboxylase subunit delta [Microvirgula curvata]
METIRFEYPAQQPVAGRVQVGVVGSGDLEVLIEPGHAGRTTIVVNTSVDGAASRWQALFDRMFAERSGEAAMQVEINDFGATPGVVRMRLEQGMELVARAAGK